MNLGVFRPPLFSKPKRPDNSDNNRLKPMAEKPRRRPQEEEIEDVTDVCTEEEAAEVDKVAADVWAQGAEKAEDAGNAASDSKSEVPLVQVRDVSEKKKPNPVPQPVNKTLDQILAEQIALNKKNTKDHEESKKSDPNYVESMKRYRANKEREAKEKQLQKKEQEKQREEELRLNRSEAAFKAAETRAKNKRMAEESLLNPPQFDAQGFTPSARFALPKNHAPRDYSPAPKKAEPDDGEWFICRRKTARKSPAPK